jgi:hypothetical protein
MQKGTMKNHSLYGYFILILIFLFKYIDGSDSNIKCRFNEQTDNIFWIGETISGFVDFIKKQKKTIMVCK